MTAVDLAALAKKGEITALFHESWDAYRRVVLLNHLHHAEVLETYKNELADLDGKEIRCLDIGVGDGFVPFTLFSAAGMPRPKVFVGVDSTAEALHIARTTNTLPADCAYDFICEDMTQYMAQHREERRFDVIMTSFTLHHLDTPGKAAILRRIYEALAPGGRLLWTDVYNHVEGRPLAETMQRWRGKFKEYHGLTQEEREKIWDHVSNYDLPEDFPTMQRLMEEAGFKQPRIAYSDGFYVGTWAANKE